MGTCLITYLDCRSEFHASIRVDEDSVGTELTSNLLRSGAGHTQYIKSMVMFKINIRAQIT